MRIAFLSGEKSLNSTASSQGGPPIRINNPMKLTLSPSDFEHSQAMFEAIVESSNDAIISKTLDGVITSWNPAAVSLFGYSSDEIIGRPMTDLIPSDRIDEEQQFLAAMARGDYVFRFETIRLRKDGSTVDVAVTLSPIRNKDGKIVGISKIAKDISREKAFEREEAKYRQQLKLFVQYTSSPIALFDRDLNYLAASSGWLEAIGQSNKDLTGRYHYDVLPKGDPRWRVVHKRCLCGETIRNEAELWINPQGQERWITWEMRPWYDDDGSIGGTTMLADDVTTYVLAQRLLAEEQQALRESQRIAHLGSGVRYGDSPKVNWSDEIYHIFGITPESFDGTFASLLAFAHPDDQKLIASARQASFGETNGFSIDFRIIRQSDGQLRWCHADFVRYRDDAGNFVRSTGTIQDISDRKALEEALAQSQARYARLSELTHEGIMIHENQIILDVNSSLCRMFGYEPDEFAGTNALNYFAPESRDLVLDQIRMQSSDPYRAIMLRKDGTVFPAGVVGRDVVYLGNRMRVVSIRDITEQVRLEEELKASEQRYMALARIDALTGLANRRTFVESAQSEFERGLRLGHNAAVLIIDIDHFKRVNDLYGHSTGDDVLVQVAKVLSASVRTTDLAARYGGEEFVVLTVGYGPESAISLAERIRASIATTRMKAPSEGFSITVSIGVAKFTDADTGWPSVFQRADACLYQAKAAGRNRVVAEEVKAAVSG